MISINLRARVLPLFDSQEARSPELLKYIILIYAKAFVSVERLYHTVFKQELLIAEVRITFLLRNGVFERDNSRSGARG
jgi:hypothetical protein